MGRVLARLAVLAGLAGFACGCSTPNLDIASISPAPGMSSSPTVPLSPPTATSLPSDAAAVIPAGFISFCMRFPDQCTAPANAPSTIPFTQSAWQTVVRVNVAVNAAIWPEDDERHYGRAEYWTISTDGYGDCEDYALTKRKLLIEAGLPEPALRMAVVVTPREGRHAVLTVSTDRGDFVLDNLSDKVVAWNATGYTWIERQDPKRPLAWASLNTAPTMMAANDQPVANIPATVQSQPTSSTSAQ